MSSTFPSMPGGLSDNPRRVDVDSALVPDSSFADLNTVIRDTCNRFSRTTGWSLTFQRAEGENADDLEARMQDDEHCYWHARVLSGFSTIGLMSIVKGREQLPEDRAKIAESPFLKSRLRRLVFPLPDACDAADIVVNLLNKIATRSQVLQLSDTPAAAVSPTSFNRNAQHRLDVLRFLSGYDAVALFLANGEDLRLVATSGAAMEAIPEPNRKPDGNLIDQQAISRLEVADVSDADDPLMPAGYARAMCVPLDRRRKGLGTVWFYSQEAETLTQNIEHAIALAGRFAGTFDDLAVTQITEDNKELRRDLRVLAQIQKVSECTEPPLDASIDYSFFSKGKSEVNGDLCEYTSLDEHRTFFAIGDACGHGLPAAVITSTVRGCLRCLVLDENPPPLSHLLRTVGNAICTTTPTYMFMTLLVGILDTRNNTLTYANAGHPAPLLLRADGTADPLEGNGLLLGVVNDADYDDFEVGINPGDTLIAFSDGITEARNKDKELFLRTGVVQAIRDANNPDATTDELLNAVLETAQEHSGDDLPDDATLLILRRQS